SRAPTKSGSVTASAGGNFLLASDFNFNRTGPRDGDGNPHGHSDQPFLDFSANGNLTIDGNIYDSEANARDALKITLTADKDQTSGGDLIINKNIYTSGGDFIASGNTFDSSAAVIDTNNASNNQNGRFSLGGNVHISASSTVKLGDVVTDVCSTASGACKGDFTVDQRSEEDRVSVEQAEGTELTIAGNTKFDVGSGSITLENDNYFAGTLVFTSACAVTIKDTSNSVDLQVSSVGSLTLSAAGKVTQSGALTITGSTTINANNSEVELNSSNNVFGGLVTLNDVSSVIVRGSGNDGVLQIGDIDVSGTNDRSAGKITLEAINGGLDAGVLSANGGTGDGNQNVRSGGAISLTAAGSITAEAINAVGSQGNSSRGSRNGGRGGNVAIASTSEGGIVRVRAIDTSGGNGSSNMGGDR